MATENTKIRLKGGFEIHTVAEWAWQNVKQGGGTTYPQALQGIFHALETGRIYEIVDG